MISVLSTTNKYIVQPNLIDMHQQSLNWLSTIALWNKELVFLQKLLDKHAADFTSTEDKKQIDRFQNLILYYHGEVIGNFRSNLVDHEKSLARSLKNLDESNTEYFTRHKALMEELAVFDLHFSKFRDDFFTFIEKVI